MTRARDVSVDGHQLSGALVELEGLVLELLQQSRIAQRGYIQGICGSLCERSLEQAYA